mmetsp:Transcript_3521/g.5456  ORF Transcript_3521/g.5456 Transcript_3521/m.5456 type:complete len:385 (-) Transcript_3521:182-1336(-)
MCNTRRFVSYRFWITSTLCMTSLLKVVSFGGISLTTRPTRNSQTHLFSTFESDRDTDKGRRSSEFRDLEPLPTSSIRRQRAEDEKTNQERFVNFGNELWDLRDEMDGLYKKLVEALNKGQTEEEEKIRQKMRDVESHDPELVYELEQINMRDALKKGKERQARKHLDNSLAARSRLPHYNLEGLWVGKYGNHGYELINVTYVDETLIAYKVTGDKNVPCGEITFKADLNPNKKVPSMLSKERLDPISLTNNAAKKWGTRKLPRYAGLGQVAEEGFVNNQFLEGQLIVIGEEYFSFAWVPIEHQIFFGRPSAELALKMLRNSGVHTLKEKGWGEKPPTVDDDIGVLKEYAHHIMEVTHSTMDDDLNGAESLGCIWHSDEDECYFE